MGKKKIQSRESALDREKAIEAEFFARKCGLTRDEVLKIIKDARFVRPLASVVREKAR
jgi:hypothetical protein